MNNLFYTVYNTVKMCTCKQMRKLMQIVQFQSFKQFFKFLWIQHLTFYVLIAYQTETCTKVNVYQTV